MTSDGRRICKRCRGRGYTPKEAPVIKDRGRGKKPRYETTAQGSGCFKCGGRGSVDV